MSHMSHMSHVTMTQYHNVTMSKYSGVSCPLWYLYISTYVSVRTYLLYIKTMSLVYNEQ